MKRSLLLVEWVDSLGGGGWVGPETFKAEVSQCVSIGMLVHQDKKSITVAGTFSERGGWCDPITIPKCSIIKTRKIKIK